MRFKIPFTFADVNKLKTRAKFLRIPIKPKKNSKLNFYLINSDVDITREDYISICFKYAGGYFLVAFILLITLCLIIQVSNFILLPLAVGLFFGLFVGGAIDDKR
jgi:hypothetical protein